MRRRRSKSLILAGVSGATAAALVIAAVVVRSGLKSPQQAAADAAPPSPSTVTVAAESRRLVESIVLRGHVQPGSAVTVTTPPGASGPDSVVTSVKVRSDQTLREGQVVAERAGQPIIVLVLPFPLYRDLTGGASGPDVTAAQQSLSRLGYRTPVTGKFDRATQDSLTRLYRSSGYPPPAAPDASAQTLTNAQAAVAEAQRALADAKATGSDVPAMQARLDAAQRTLAEAQVAAGPALPRNGVLRLDRGNRKISKVLIVVGSVLSNPDTPLLELDGEPPFVTVDATKDQAAAVQIGQSAEVLDELTGARVRAIVDYAGEAHSGTDTTPPRTDTPPRQTDTASGSAFQVRLKFVDTPLPVITNRTVRVDLSTTVGSGEPVLAVPVTAVYARADGSTFVTVLSPDGSTVDVTVTAGQIAGGWVQVTPSDPAALRPGTTVVVSETASGVPR